MADVVTASLFGTFRLVRGMQDVRPRGRKACGLVAHLVATDRRSASRARLAELLWSDRGEEQARNSLRQGLRELRAGALGEALVVSRLEVAIPRDRVADDAERIAALADDGDCAGLAALLADMEGEYLHDLDGLSPGYDDWLRVERTRRRDWLFAAALRCAGGPDALPGADRRAVLRELERLDPLNEIVVRSLLRADHADGDVAAMHRRIRRLTHDLSRELGVAPSPETRHLLDALLARAPPAAPEREAVPSPALRGAEPARTLPVVALFPFTAEDEAVRRLAAMLTDAVGMALSHNAEFRVVRADMIGAERLLALFPRAIAGFALRGGVRIDGTAAVARVELAEAVDGFIIWAEQLESGPADTDRVPAMVARIAGAILPGIERHLADSARIAPADPPPEGAAALYLLGRRQAREARTLAGVRDAMALLDRAIALDPRHVGARLRLAQLCNTDLHYLLAGHDVAALRERALRLTVEAAGIEPASVRVKLRLAWCQLRQEKWDGASALFHELAAQAGHDADALNEIGFGLAQLGERDAAMRLIQLAFRLNPFAPAEYHADLAVLLALDGRHADAEAHFDLCGEQRLFWQVLRMSNLHRLDRGSAKLRAMEARFVDMFRAIWVRPDPPALDDVLRWSRLTFCFGRPEDRALVTDALAAAWT